MRARTKVSWILSAGLFLATLGGSAAIAEQSPLDTSQEASEGTYVSYEYVYFDNDASIDQLEAHRSLIVEDFGEPVGYRFENDDIVGEFLLSDEQTLESFTQSFEEMFGTQPEFAAAMYAEGTLPDVVDGETAAVTIPGGEFEANASQLVDSSFLTDSTLENPNSGAGTSKAPNRWGPEVVDASVMRIDNKQHFVLKMAWGENSPRNMPSKFGIEFEVNLYNGATGERPFCKSGYKDAFLAKREGWHSWFVQLPSGAGLREAEPYADYNDLLDSCGQNSMAVGLRYGTKVPAMANGKYSLFVGIVAPIGTQRSNLVGGVIQTIDNESCAMLINPKLTDCMGLAQQSYGSQLFLSTLRDWHATPNLCWRSTGYGQNAPVKYAC